MRTEFEQTISKATVARLPEYLRYLKGQAERGEMFISSSKLAKDMGLSAVGVRKDLALVSSNSGKPRMGFEIATLLSDIERYLGYHRKSDAVNAVIVGAGGLGRAILSYEGFENYGINVVAAFDVSPSKIGAVGGKPVYPMERLSEIVRRSDARTGILTVPKSAAQSACDEMVKAGVKAILNFAPVYLSVPEGVLVKCEDLAASLADLSGKLPQSV